MEWIDVTLPTLPENIALDEVLLDHVEQGRSERLLRFWEMDSIGVVLGRGSRVEQEVDLARCQSDRVPVVRRISGGCAVLSGPGCLMYSLVLRRDPGQAALANPVSAHAWVLDPLARQLTQIGTSTVELQGISDLAISGRKCSGNSVRLLRHAILYHGTLLHGLSLPAMMRYLPQPPREPDYRKSRRHDNFVTRLQFGSDELREACRRAWSATASRGFEEDWMDRVAGLVASRYSLDSWNLRW